MVDIPINIAKSHIRMILFFMYKKFRLDINFENTERHLFMDIVIYDLPPLLKGL